MKRQHLIMTAVPVAVVAAMLIGTAGHTAEKRGEKEQPRLNAVTRVDVGPLLNKIDDLEAEIARLRATTEEIGRSLKTIQESVGDMQDSMASLKRPDKWQYHFLYRVSKTAANKLCEQGWECIAAHTNYILFRKPLVEEPQE